MKAILTTTFLVYCAAATFLVAALGDLNHDEHQFLASAHLVAEEGLHPYRDYAYFHMPNLVYIYSLVFFLTDDAFLWIRILTAVLSFTTLVLLFRNTRQVLQARGGFTAMQSLLVAMAIGLLYVNTPLVARAGAFAWNHASSALFAVSAILVHLRLIRSVMQNSPKLMCIALASGFFLGMAIGIRLSWAPLIIPFILACFYGRSWSDHVSYMVLAAFGIGGVLANIPGLYFLASETHAFMFGNLGYAELNTLYRESLGHGSAMTIIGKLQYAAGVLIYPVGNIFIPLWLGLAIQPLRFREALTWLRQDRSCLFLYSLIPFVLVGSFAPSPMWSQYLFSLFPVLFLCLAHTIKAATWHKGIYRRWLLGATVALSFLCGPLLGTPDLWGKIGGVATFQGLREGFNPANWTGVQMEILADVVDEDYRWKNLQQSEGRILTTAPIFVMDGPISIYHTFVTGPFAWRVSSFLGHDEQEALKLPSAELVEQWFKSDPPLALVTHGKSYDSHGVDADLRRLAMAHHYIQSDLPHDIVLWTKPADVEMNTDESLQPPLAQ